MKKKIIIVAIVVLALIGIGTGTMYFSHTGIFSVETEEVQKTDTDKPISYKGIDGKTALELLEKNYTVVKSGAGVNSFVTSINGVSANPSTQYWAFKIDGKTAIVGAGSYITKNSDTITWELTSITTGL